MPVGVLGKLAPAVGRGHAKPRLTHVYSRGNSLTGRGLPRRCKQTYAERNALVGGSIEPAVDPVEKVVATYSLAAVESTLDRT
jgi:hypothetical protein